MVALFLLVFGTTVAIAGVFRAQAAAAITAPRDTLLAVPPDARSITLSTTLSSDAAAQEAAAENLWSKVLPGVRLTVQRTVTTPTVAWTLTPDPTALLPADLPVLERALPQLPQTANNTVGLNVGGVRMVGGLATTVTVLRETDRAAAGIATSSFLILLVLVTVHLAVLLAALRFRRADTDRLLLLRGLSRPKLFVVGLIEGPVPTLPAAAIGAVAVESWPAPITGLQTAAGSWSIAGTIALVTVIGHAAFTLRSPTPTSAAGRRGVAVVLAPIVLIGVLAAAAVWRLRRLGSTSTAAGAIDPLAVAAPVTALVGAVLMLAVVGLQLVGLVGRGARGGAHLAWPFTAADISRRWPVFGLVLIIIGSAVASAFLVSAFQSTWDTFRHDAGRFINGADLVVALPTGSTEGQPDDRAAAERQLPGSSVVPSDLISTTSGPETVILTALPARDMSAVLPTLAGTFDAGSAADELGMAAPPGPALPRGTTAIDVDSAVTVSEPPLNDTGGQSLPVPSGAGVTVRIWLDDTAGNLVSETFPPIPIPQPAANGTARQVRTHLRVGVGAPTGAWHLVGVDTAVDAGLSLLINSVDLTNWSTDGTSARAALDVSTASWSPVAADPQTADANLFLRSGNVIGWGGSLPPMSGPITVRLLAVSQGSGPGSADSPPTALPVPMIIDSHTAQLLQAKVNDRIDLDITASTAHVTGRVVGIVAALPGTATPSHVLVDLPTFQLAQLTSAIQLSVADHLLISVSPGTDLSAAADLVRRQWPGAAVTPAGSGTASAVTARTTRLLWVNAGVELALAVFSLISLQWLVRRGRGSDDRILHALGVPADRLGRLRRRETAAVLALGVVSGGLGGWFTGAVVLDDLVRSAVVDAPSARPAMSIAPVWWWGLGAVTLAIVVMVAWPARGRALGTVP